LENRCVSSGTSEVRSGFETMDGAETWLGGGMVGISVENLGKVEVPLKPSPQMEGLESIESIGYYGYGKSWGMMVIIG